MPRFPMQRSRSRKPKPAEGNEALVNSPVRLKDVEEAQTAVVTLAKELSNSGQITISEGKDEGELVY